MGNQGSQCLLCMVVMQHARVKAMEGDLVIQTGRTGRGVGTLFAGYMHVSCEVVWGSAAHFIWLSSDFLDLSHSFSCSRDTTVVVLVRMELKGGETFGKVQVRVCVSACV